MNMTHVKVKSGESEWLRNIWLDGWRPTREQMLADIEALEEARAKVGQERRSGPIGTVPVGLCPARDGLPHGIEWTNYRAVGTIPASRHGVCRQCRKSFLD